MDRTWTVSDLKGPALIYSEQTEPTAQMRVVKRGELLVPVTRAESTELHVSNTDPANHVQPGTSLASLLMGDNLSAPDKPLTNKTRR